MPSPNTPRERRLGSARRPGAREAQGFSGAAIGITSTPLPVGENWVLRSAGVSAAGQPGSPPPRQCRESPAAADGGGVHVEAPMDHLLFQPLMIAETVAVERNLSYEPDTIHP